MKGKKRSWNSDITLAVWEATDEALMLAYRGGDARAFETLYRRHRGALSLHPALAQAARGRRRALPGGMDARRWARG